VFEKLPVKMLELVSNIPIVGSKKLKNAAKTLLTVQSKIENSLNTFQFFLQGNFMFENKEIYNITSKMSPEERAEFHCDCRVIEWKPYLLKYIKGLSIWVLKEDHTLPSDNFEQILIKNYTRFYDLNNTLYN